MIEDYPEKLKLVMTDEKLLRQPSQQVLLGKPEQVKSAQSFISQLQNILYIDPEKGLVDGNTIGMGLAACQLKSAYPDPLRVGIIRIPKMSEEQKPLSLNLINPQIIDMQQPFKHRGEGCISFPKQFLTTKRFQAIKLGFIDAYTLEPRELQLYSLEAVVAQHEVDHHDGILFFDRYQKPVVSDKKAGPNDPCVCGSGKKYKKCCME